MTRNRLAATLLLLLLTGCPPSGPSPVNATIPIGLNVRLGPGAGLEPGEDVTNLSFPLGEFCQILDSAALQQIVQNASGTEGPLDINRVLLKGIVFSLRRGDFLGFDHIDLYLQLGANPEQLYGTINADAGLGTGFTLTPASTDEIDLIPLLATDNCLTLRMVFSGTTPSINLDMRLDAFVTIEATPAAS
jgi:hypothetical protein